MNRLTKVIHACGKTVVVYTHGKYEDTTAGEMEHEDIRNVMKCLSDYENTGLAPQQIMEMKESACRLDKIFGDTITVDQVINFFLDFYIANGDPGRAEAAELLTNEEVARYRELKERDTAKTVREADCDMGYYICPACGTAISYMEDGYTSHKFCLNCGQRLMWGSDNGKDTVHKQFEKNGRSSSPQEKR